MWEMYQVSGKKRAPWVISRDSGEFIRPSMLWPQTAVMALRRRLSRLVANPWGDGDWLSLGFQSKGELFEVRAVAFIPEDVLLSVRRRGGLPSSVQESSSSVGGLHGAAKYHEIEAVGAVMRRRPCSIMVVWGLRRRRSLQPPAPTIHHDHETTFGGPGKKRPNGEDKISRGEGWRRGFPRTNCPQRY